MPKIKLTKSELKKQRDDLKQFTRFLPTLQLKKQQLQLEMRQCRAEVENVEREETEAKKSVAPWIGLFADPSMISIVSEASRVENVDRKTKNIAGVDVPVFESITFSEVEIDLFSTDTWVDDAIDTAKKLAELRVRKEIIEEQYRLIHEELRTTTQRVNLFEKVKIPECKENIRQIQIYLGDQQTAAVGRSKMAKRKMEETAEAEKAKEAAA
jgi:V/A-type H+-transporting ATPase subunit D